MACENHYFRYLMAPLSLLGGVYVRYETPNLVSAEDAVKTDGNELKAGRNWLQCSSKGTLYLAGTKMSPLIDTSIHGVSNTRLFLSNNHV